MTVQAPVPLRVECSWCDRVVQDGPKDGSESHSICEPCLARELVLAGLDQADAA